jgi:C4-dicarboxylate transporter DctM subunit
MGLILFGCFALLLFLRVPVSFSLGISATVCLIIMDVPLAVIGQKMFNALDSFSIMAIPFFILSGNLMTEGGISKRLVDLASAIFGRIRGGLALASVLACGMFGALSGSGPATCLSVGAMIYPELIKQGYEEDTMAGLIAVAGSLGPIIPPSIIMVFYGTVTNTSITQMFSGGIGAGLTLMIALIVITAYMASKKQWPKEAKKEKSELSSLWISFKGAIWALLMPVIVLGGIYSGLFTPTESAAVSVIYSVVVGGFVYKELKPKPALRVLRDSAVSATIVLFIISTSSIFAWVFTYANIASSINNFVLSLSIGKTLYLFIVCIIMLIFGTFMDATATVVLLMPAMQPIAISLGIDPVFFGVLVCVALTIGGITPPVAVNIFSMASVSNLPMNRVVKGEIPFLIVSVTVLFVLMLFPQIIMFFPKLLS